MKNEIIDKAIESVGITQLGFGRLIGVSQSTVSDWLNNKKKVSPRLVPLIVKLTHGTVKPYEIRPDLPDLFPHPKGYSHASEPKHTDV
ncbi:TPA: helix-turn-helix domain-containing protein [Morganella morganii]|uniref:transcriptional regulator n=1 Tax=Enterobacterales TaxID=91347 RepID=UPI001A1BBC4C|nr:MULTISPECIES: helix-turn-helix domain-containing protein [Enterobacterales]MCU6211020.1 helix-turn-helix domain-containing protein [Morganella morganii]HAT1515390.1 helix-turn-helix domain-containing protein [Morganella morganii]